MTGAEQHAFAFGLTMGLSMGAAFRFGWLLMDSLLSRWGRHG